MDHISPLSNNRLTRGCEVNRQNATGCGVFRPCKGNRHASRRWRTSINIYHLLIFIYLRFQPTLWSQNLRISIFPRTGIIMSWPVGLRLIKISIYFPTRSRNYTFNCSFSLFPFFSLYNPSKSMQQFWDTKTKNPKQTKRDHILWRSFL